ncbi:MAG: IMP dehydrogenase, partial [Saprospiraceae bacterium]|nr:IMP dehydrogenase [Saprospiraceae bacterium]
METKNNGLPKEIVEALTFDDVLLIPSYSEVLPREVDISTQLTTDIRLNVPIISAAMDTVTEEKLAIAIAREGGIGIIHKNMSIAKHAEQVRSVKRSESGMIKDPVTLGGNAKLVDALQLMQRFKIGGIPVVDDTNHLIGILTNRDIRFETDLDRPVTELMTRDRLITAPIGTDLQQAQAILQKHKIEKLPVVNDENKLVGLITYKDILKLESYPNSCKDSLGRLVVGAALGVTKDTLERLEALIEVDVDVIVIDTAHGHSQGVLNTIKAVRQKYPDLQIIGGNVGTGAGAKALVEAGVNAVKVGIGPGSICTTRIVTGVGVPQLYAIMSVAQALQGTGVPVIGDGGIRYTGDIAKAIASGADTIMAGSLFAGVEEAPGETVIFEG